MLRDRSLVGAVLKSLSLAAGLAASVSAAGRPVAWVQMTASGAEARLVTAAARCPLIIVDGRARAMTERAAPDEAFPGRVCAAALKRQDRSASIEGSSLPVPRPRPSRLVILGDSGCRLKGRAFQHCNDPSGWPFARIAALAAARKPDLVIHVGDYYYRETPCPAGKAGCAGSPYGDRWPTWKAELFDPAAPLLAAAPWVFARGNHEGCKRGGPGWFRLLDAAPRVQTCPTSSRPYFVELGGARLLLADSADAPDLIATGEAVAAFSASLGAPRPGIPQASLGAPRPGGEPTWIVTHRPIWNPFRLGDLVTDGLINATERQAVRGVDLSDVTLVLSGHVHDFSALSFGAARPAQLVVGTGGDILDMDDTPPPAAGQAQVDGMKADIFTMGRWGYFVLDRHGGDWLGEFRDTADRLAATCRLHGRALTCRATTG